MKTIISREEFAKAVNFGEHPVLTIDRQNMVAYMKDAKLELILEILEQGKEI